MDYEELIGGAKKKFHFLGIGGIGMSATAKLLKDIGHTITGSDNNMYPPVTTYLKQKNIQFNKSFNKNNIPKDVDYIVIGKNRQLVSKENVEVQEAMRLNIPKLSFPEILNILTKKTHNVVVVGSHGKSSCAGIASFCLEYAKKSPSFFIGAIMYDLEESSKVGKSNIFVLEGDEYPTSEKDSTSKFLYYNPTDILITSLNHDHFNIFKTKEDYKKPFIKLLNILNKTPLIVVNKDNEEIKTLTDKMNNDSYITYSISQDADWSAKEIKDDGDITSFKLLNKGKVIGNIETKIFGIHNVENIVGTAALLLERNHISIDDFIGALKIYKGIKRRLDNITKNSKIQVYEGFGSSAEKVIVAINAIKPRKKNRLVVLFEPFAMSWKLRSYIDKYTNLFDGSDVVYFYKKPINNELKKDLNIKEILDKINHPNIKIIDDKENALKMLKNELKEGDTVLALSSGNFDNILNELVEWLEKEKTNL